MQRDLTATIYYDKQSKGSREIESIKGPYPLAGVRAITCIIKRVSEENPDR